MADRRAVGGKVRSGVAHCPKRVTAALARVMEHSRMDATLERWNAPTLFYQVDGAGPNVVLIHGVGADGSSWDEIIPALTPRFTVIRLDLRGHGRSGHIDGALALDDFA